MRRHEFITLLGGAAAWPLAARAQQGSVPVVGFVRSTSAAELDAPRDRVPPGLEGSGFVEGLQHIVRVQQHSDQLGLGSEVVQLAELLRDDIDRGEGHPRHVAARPIEIGNQARFSERSHQVQGARLRSHAQEADHRHRRLLRTRCERPRGCRAAD